MSHLINCNYSWDEKKSGGARKTIKFSIKGQDTYYSSKLNFSIFEINRDYMYSLSNPIQI